MRLVGVDHALARAAGTLAEAHALRGYDAVHLATALSIDDLRDPKYFPYRWGQAFWAYVGGRYGDDAIRRMLAIAAAAGDPNVGIEKVLGVKTKQLSEDWQAAIRSASLKPSSGLAPDAF